MRTTHQTAPRTRALRLGGVAAGLGTAALAAGFFGAGSSPAFAADDRAVASTPDKVDNTLWVLVNGQSGGIARSDFHNVSSQKLAGGLDGQPYRVTFDRDIRDCAFLATLTTAFAGDLVNADTGIAIKQNRSFETRQVVDIITKDSQPVPVREDASSFSLLIECAR